MNCQNCNNLLSAPQGKFCPYCGAENSQQFNAAVQQPIPQPAFQPQFQQPENKSTPTWVIVLIVAAVVFFLTLCCGGSILLVNSLDDLSPATTGMTTDTTTTGTADSLGIPTDNEIVLYLEDRYGVSFRVLWSIRDSDRPILELKPLNQVDMDFFFEVKLADRDGNWFTLNEIEDGFLLGLASSEIEGAVRSFAEDMFGREGIEDISVFSFLGRSGAETLPQSINWSPDDGVDVLRQMIVDELADELYVSITVRLDESQDLDDVSWEQIEDLAEKLTASGHYGAFNSMSVRIGWAGDSMFLYWDAQNGEIFSLERFDW